MDGIYQRMRPGYGKSYVTVIAKCNADGSVNEKDSEFMRKEAEILVQLQPWTEHT